MQSLKSLTFLLTFALFLVVPSSLFATNRNILVCTTNDVELRIQNHGVASILANDIECKGTVKKFQDIKLEHGFHYDFEIAIGKCGVKALSNKVFDYSYFNVESARAFAVTDIKSVLSLGPREKKTCKLSFTNQPVIRKYKGFNP